MHAGRHWAEGIAVLYCVQLEWSDITAAPPVRAQDAATQKQLEKQSRLIQACTAKEALDQGTMFRRHADGIRGYSSCGTGKWLQLYADVEFGKPKVPAGELENNCVSAAVA